MTDIPTTMKRCVLAEPNEDMSKVVLKVEEVPVPVPGPGEVLIKVCAAPINPSDYGVWRFTKPAKCPMPIGNEGCGIIVASGGGLSTMISGRVGSKVGFVNLPKKQGSFSEYVVASALMSTFPMPDDLPIENAASFFINPYTAVGMIETAQQLGANGFIHTAAASQVGQMLVKLAPQRNITLINLVRREEQAETLRKLGAQHVIVTSESGWEAKLSECIEKHKIRVAFDAIAGPMSGTLLSLLPSKGVCYVYGGLSSQPVGNINPMDLIYLRKEVRGWLLTNWLKGGGSIQTLRRLRAARILVNPGLQPGGWAESRFVDCTLDDFFPKFLKMYNEGGFTDAKLRLRLGEA